MRSMQTTTPAPYFAHSIWASTLLGVVRFVRATGKPQPQCTCTPLMRLSSHALGHRLLYAPTSAGTRKRTSRPGWNPLSAVISIVFCVFIFWAPCLLYHIRPAGAGVVSFVAFVSEIIRRPSRRLLLPQEVPTPFRDASWRRVRRRSEPRTQARGAPQNIFELVRVLVVRLYT